jgi:hypothetical protein
MFLLRNNERFYRLAAIEPRKGIRPLALLSSWRLRGRPVVGQWAELGDTRLAVYSDGVSARLIIGEEDLPLSAVLEASHQISSDGLHQLTVWLPGDQPRTVTYEGAIAYERNRGSIEIDDRSLHAHVEGYAPENEDSDFGLYVANTINRPKRQGWLVERAQRAMAGELTADEAFQPQTLSQAAFEILRSLFGGEIAGTRRDETGAGSS